MKDRVAWTDDVHACFDLGAAFERFLDQSRLMVQTGQDCPLFITHSAQIGLSAYSSNLATINAVFKRLLVLQRHFSRIRFCIPHRHANFREFLFLPNPLNRPKS